jgi:hypothetical protein
VRCLVLALLAVLGACAEPPAPVLAELASFHGRVRVAPAPGGGVAPFTAELAFDRASGNLQLTERGAATTVALSRRPDGACQAFEDGVPRAADAAEKARLALVATLVEPAAGTTVRDRTASGYTVVNTGGAIVVLILEVFGEGAHGWR